MSSSSTARAASGARRSDEALETSLACYRTASRARASGSAKAPVDGTRVGHYATAAASALALAGSAEAAVIYSGIQNIDHGIGSFAAAIDIDGDLNADLRIRADAWQTSHFASSGTSWFRTYSEYARVWGTGGRADLVMDAGSPTRLSSGNTISAGRSFGGGGILNGARRSVRMVAGNLYDTTRDRGNWPASGSGLLGFALQRDGATHYGWIRLRLDDTGEYAVAGAADEVRVVDWAYESVPDRSILAGATVPEPSTLTLLASGVLGLLAFRRRRTRKANDA